MIRTEAKKLGLEDDLAIALVSYLSNFDSNKKTFDPNFTNTVSLFEVKNRTPRFNVKDEIKNQATRWGVFQIYGALARGMNYFEPLENLLDERVNISLGLKLLRYLDQKYEQESFMISAFIGVGVADKLSFGFNNQKGIDAVRARLKMLRSKNFN